MQIRRTCGSFSATCRSSRSRRRRYTVKTKDSATRVERRMKTRLPLFEKKGRTRVNAMTNWVVSFDEDSFVKWLLLAEKLTICIVMNRMSCRHEVTVKEQRPKTLSCSNYEEKNDLCGYTEETKYCAKYTKFGQITKLKTSLWSGWPVEFIACLRFALYSLWCKSKDPIQAWWIIKMLISCICPWKRCKEKDVNSNHT